MEKLTKGQKEALEAVRTGRNVCITGGGGVGKSYISRKIIEDLQKQRKTVLITASTGRAAMLIGGITCHRAFNIPVKLTWQAEPKDYYIITNLRSGCGDHRRGIYAADRCV
jgi:hypothetical protein